MSNVVRSLSQWRMADDPRPRLAPFDQIGAIRPREKVLLACPLHQILQDTITPVGALVEDALKVLGGPKAKAIFRVLFAVHVRYMLPR